MQFEFDLIRDITCTPACTIKSLNTVTNMFINNRVDNKSLAWSYIDYIRGHYWFNKQSDSVKKLFEAVSNSNILSNKIKIRVNNWLLTGKPYSLDESCDADCDNDYDNDYDYYNYYNYCCNNQGD